LKRFDNFDRFFRLVGLRDRENPQPIIFYLIKRVNIKLARRAGKSRQGRFSRGFEVVNKGKSII